MENSVTMPGAGKEMSSVLVIGGGPGGYVAAIRAAQLGAKVTLVEADKLGGTCLNRGCMPTKALLHSAEIYEKVLGASAAGITAEEVRVDWDRVQANRQAVTEKLTSGVRSLMKANRVELVSGRARFTGPKTVEVEGRELTADRIIIASGSFPLMPEIPGLKESQACMDSTDCLTLDHIPDSLLVIGGGVVGIELGSVYARFGAKVTVVELSGRLLPLMDEELTRLLQSRLEGMGMRILTGSRVESVSDIDGCAQVTVAGPGGSETIEAEKILVCTGRGPNTGSLDLEKAQIGCDGGFIRVNDRMETDVPGVYAVGDCNGRLMLAHAAMAMGEVAAENAMGGNRSFRAELSPSCAYVGPEFAGVGYTEEQLKNMGVDYQSGKFPAAGNGRCLVEGETGGMFKVLIGSRFGEILGVHILAPGATELIEEAALAMRLECTAEELIDTIHCHPTVSEALRECVMAAEKRAIHMPNRK